MEEFVKVYKVESGPKIPHVVLDSEQGVFEIKGRSIPEDSAKLYKPMLEWMNQYAESPQKKTTVNIHLEYLNTSSSKHLLDFFKILEVIHQGKEGKVEVNWIYEEMDLDMEEAGEDYQALIKIPINLQEIESEE